MKLFWRFCEEQDWLYDDEERKKRMWGRLTIHIGEWNYTLHSKTNPPAPIRFWGRMLGTYEEYVRGGVRCTVSLYQQVRGRLILHTLEDDTVAMRARAWIELVKPADIDAGGKYQRVGWALGLARPLTVKEGVEMSASLQQKWREQDEGGTGNGSTNE